MNLKFIQEVEKGEEKKEAMNHRLSLINYRTRLLYCSHVRG